MGETPSNPSTRDRGDRSVETTAADDEELEAGHEVTAYAWNGRWVTDRARMQRELDGPYGELGRLGHKGATRPTAALPPRTQKTPPERGFRVKRLMGFEPTTFCMASRRSSQLSYSRANGEYSPGPGVNPGRSGLPVS